MAPRGVPSSTVDPQDAGAPTQSEARRGPRYARDTVVPKVPQTLLSKNEFVPVPVDREDVLRTVGQGLDLAP